MSLQLPSTIESDDEVSLSESSEDEEEKQGENNVEKEESFSFAFDDESAFGGHISQKSEVKSWNFKTAIDMLSGQGAKKPFTLLSDDHIAAKRKSANKRISANKKASEKTLEETNDGTSENSDPSESESGNEFEDANLPDDEDDLRDMHVSAAEIAAKSRAERKKSKTDRSDRAGDDGGGGATNTLDDEEGAADYFDKGMNFLPGDEKENEREIYFSHLNLSRPLMRGIESMGFVRPTPIQARTIPIALAGRDVCGSAVTGSGKTAAFLLPILERLLYRPSGVAVTRVLIIVPTRELAAQCHAMATSLARFCEPPISMSLITGGTKNLRPQEAELRKCPDMVVCTPGRMLDHLRNSQGVHFDKLNVLVLDEVDRLLELGFKDEVEELVSSCPVERQSLLFSATMNTTVQSLVSLSLRRPVRVGVDVQGHVAGRLIQEFIRIKSSSESDRAAILASLVSRTFTERVIVFFDTKVAAHRFSLLLGLLGVKNAELHGDLTQIQRLESLELFRSAKVGVLLATDLAARGLDIPQVQTVINFEMPRQAQTYVHRVGRTARAGKSGRSVTLIGEQRRLVMKEVLRGMDSEQRDAIKTRAVAPSVLDHYKTLISNLEGDVDALLNDEKDLKELRVAEMHLHRAENLLNKEDEITNRPARTWFQSERDKTRARDASKEAVEAAAKGNLKKKRTPTEILKQVDKSLRKGEGAGGGKVEAGMHRLSRKKRRRLERLAGMDYDVAENMVDQESSKARKYQDDEEDDDMTRRQKVKKTLSKADESFSAKKAEVVGKAAKRKAKATNQPSRMGLAEDGNETSPAAQTFWGKQQEQMMRELAGDVGNKKVRRRVTTVVDDGDESGAKPEGSSESGSNKKGAFGFTEFDPMRVRVKKKKGADRSGSFKSQKKHKRR